MRSTCVARFDSTEFNVTCCRRHVSLALIPAASTTSQAAVSRVKSRATVTCGCLAPAGAWRRSEGGHSGGATLMVSKRVLVLGQCRRSGGALGLDFARLGRTFGATGQGHMAVSWHQAGANLTTIWGAPVMFLSLARLKMGGWHHYSSCWLYPAHSRWGAVASASAHCCWVGLPGSGSSFCGSPWMKAPGSGNSKPRRTSGCNQALRLTAHGHRAARVQALQELTGGRCLRTAD